MWEKYHERGSDSQQESSPTLQTYPIFMGGTGDDWKSWIGSMLSGAVTGFPDTESSKSFNVHRSPRHDPQPHPAPRRCVEFVCVPR